MPAKAADYRNISPFSVRARQKGLPGQTSEKTVPKMFHTVHMHATDQRQNEPLSTWTAQLPLYKKGTGKTPP